MPAQFECIWRHASSIFHQAKLRSSKLVAARTPFLSALEFTRAQQLKG
jgi:hypothetical protein